MKYSFQYKLLRRFLLTIVSMWALLTLTFVLLQLFPGSPYDDEIQLHPTVQEQVRASLGLDQSPWQQYLTYSSHVLRGDLGVSQIYKGRTVQDIIALHFPATLQLTSCALVLALFLSVGGTLLAQSWSAAGRIFQIVVISILSLPTLFIGPLLILVFGVQLQWFPTALLTTPISYVLPVFLLSLRPAAGLARLLWSSMEEARQTMDIQFLRGLGVSEPRLRMKYVLKKSTVPFLSYLAYVSSGLLAGSAVVEVLFAIQGMGSQFVDAVLNRDATVVIGLTLFYGFFVMLFQFVFECAVVALDPRLRDAN